LEAKIHAAAFTATTTLRISIETAFDVTALCGKLFMGRVCTSRFLLCDLALISRFTVVDTTIVFVVSVASLVELLSTGPIRSDLNLD
jgi:hypothetical protein